MAMPAPPDIVMSEAERMLTSSAVASDAEITAARLISAAVIEMGPVLSELQAASISIGAPRRSERFIRISSLGWEGAATIENSASALRPFDALPSPVVT